MLRLEDGELGDERLGKENSLHGAGQEVTVGRDSPCSALGCSHLCIVETPQPGCRRERCSPRRAAVHGVLWLLPDKLPKRLKPSPQLVCPACEDEEISHRGDWCEVKSVAQGIRLRVLPLSPALGCQHWTEPSYFPRESFTVTSFFMQKKTHSGCSSTALLSIPPSCALPRLLFPVEAGHGQGPAGPWARHLPQALCVHCRMNSQGTSREHVCPAGRVGTCLQGESAAAVEAQAQGQGPVQHLCFQPTSIKVPLSCTWG